MQLEPWKYLLVKRERKKRVRVTYVLYKSTDQKRPMPPIVSKSEAEE